jgi:hypothetical protein
MRSRLIVPLLGLCLLASCSRIEPESFEALGGTTMSGAPGGHYSFRAYRYQKGDRLAVAGIVERPGQAGAHPAFVVLYRLPNRDRPSFSVKSGSGLPGSRISFEQSFSPASGGTCTVLYELKGEPEAEHWLINEKPYPVEAGRVALADLTKDPPKVTQVRADLSGLFPTLELNQEQMKAGLDKLLRERSEEARTFFDPGR